MKNRDRDHKSLKNKMAGKVVLVGAGPGDPGLMTIKGLRALKRAHVVLFDNLISKVLLQKAPREAVLIDAGKRPGQHTLTQDRINDLLYRYAQKGRYVVRLKGGDSYVFGRGGEEAVFLRDRGVAVEVVPGVTSAIAVPALAGIPVTQRHVAMTVAFVSGHVTTDNDPIPTPDTDTLVYVMCVTDIEKTVKRLIRKRKKTVPCAVIEKGTFSSERVISGTLGDIVRRTREARIVSPAVFVVGEVVRLRERILRKKILVTGTRSERFRERGDVTYCPLVKILPVRQVRAIDKAVEEIRENDWILFTSQHAVYHFLDRIRQRADLKILKNKNVLAIGPATADALKARGFARVFLPREYHSGGVLKFFEKYDLRGKNVLIPRSSLAGELIPDGLRKQGARVRCVTVYRNIRLKPVVSSLDGFREVIFTCPSTVRNFFHYFRRIPSGIKVYAIGPVTQAQLKRFGIQSEILSHDDQKNIH